MQRIKAIFTRKSQRIPEPPDADLLPKPVEGSPPVDQTTLRAT